MIQLEIRIGFFPMYEEATPVLLLTRRSFWFALFIRQGVGTEGAAQRPYSLFCFYRGRVQAIVGTFVCCKHSQLSYEAPSRRICVARLVKAGRETNVVFKEKKFILPRFQTKSCIVSTV